MTEDRTGSPVLSQSRAALELLLGQKMKALLCCALLLATTLALAQDTGWLNPSVDFGQFAFGWRAYYNDNQSAIIVSAYDVIFHDYWGYGIGLPPSARITGIEVRLDAWHWRFGWDFESYLWVELSWDGGESWTSTGYGTGRLPLTETTYVLGGPSNLWGRSAWSPDELSDLNFRVRVLGIGTARLDWVAVRIYYSTGLALDIDPKTVDLGNLSLADYDRGYLEKLSIQNVSLTSPASWTLYIAATTYTWRYSGALPDPKKPCGHLLWRVESWQGSVSSANTAFAPLSIADAIVAKGTAGSAKIAMSFRLLVDYDTTWPGTYSLDFRYTLTSP